MLRLWLGMASHTVGIDMRQAERRNETIAAFTNENA
jgi:hypothetical protein